MTHSYKSYWITWFVLLVVTLAMMAAGRSTWAFGALLGALLIGMLVKVTLIAGKFMHLGSERRSLILIVALSSILTGLALFTGIATDAARIARTSTEPRASVPGQP